MRNPFRKKYGTQPIPDPEAIGRQMPMADEDVTGPMKDVGDMLAELGDFCHDNDLTIVAMVVPNSDMAKAIVSGPKAEVVHLPFMAGYPPIMPFMVDELRGHATEFAIEYVGEAEGRRP